MWVTRDGHRLAIFVPRLHALAARGGLTPAELAEELGRLTRDARHLGAIRRPLTRARRPVFVTRRPRPRRIITRPVLAPPRRWAPPYWPRHHYWPAGYWPDYAVVGVEPYVVEAPPAVDVPLLDEPTLPPDDTDDPEPDAGDAEPPAPEDEEDLIEALLLEMSGGARGGRR